MVNEVLASAPDSSPSITSWRTKPLERRSQEECRDQLQNEDYGGIQGSISHKRDFHMLQACFCVPSGMLLSQACVHVNLSHAQQLLCQTTWVNHERFYHNR